MTNYKNRVCDKLLEHKLQGVGAVLLEGPKWCGKTTTCERLAKSALYMGDPVEKEGSSKNLVETAGCPAGRWAPQKARRY